MPELPRGTVTLLFTDIEGSTRMLQELGREAYVRALTEHRQLLREAFTSHGGVEVEMQGDSFHFAFPYARDAVAAAVAGQRALAEHTWASEPIRVRIGLHTGEPMQADGLYAGLDVHHAARIMSAAHGGQVLLSARTAELVTGELPEGLEMTDLGEHRLKDLAAPRRLYQAGHGDFPPLNSLSTTNLPFAVSPLIGRERELRELLALLRSGARVVTVTGPGGTGKTRLALQAAADLVDGFRDGVFWVPLASVAEAELVPAAVAEALGTQGDLAAGLRSKELLLLLDNAEHVLEGVAAVVQTAADSPSVRLLVTSRSALRVGGELEYVLSALTEADAVQLFVERARGAGVELEVDAAVIAVCARLDNLPLALELAAARTKLLAPRALLARLGKALPLLRAGARDAPERQRTLEATIEWSYDLLEEDARRVFAQLSVFIGTFGLESAEEVCGCPLEALAALVELSLVKATGESRFLMLETIREYAADRLGESGEADALLDRHADHYLALAAELATTVTRAARERLSVDIANVRAALVHVGRTEPARALRACVGLGPFWNARAPLEGLRAFQSLYRSDVEPGLRLDALRELAFFAFQADEFEEMKRRADERLELARALGNQKAASGALLSLAQFAWHAGAAADGRRLGDEALNELYPLGDDALVARALWQIGAAEQQFGDADAAVAVFEQSLSLATSANEFHSAAWSRLGIGIARCRLGHWEQAGSPLAQGLAYFHGVGETKAVANCLDHLAAVAGATGRSVLAARLHGAADAAWASIGVPLEHAYRQEWVHQGIDAARAALGDEYEIERQRGESAGVDGALADALSVD